MASRASADRLQPLPADGRPRAVIESVTPSVDCGRFAAKRVLGDVVQVEADCFTDGHDVIACVVRFRHDDETDWHEAPMETIGNDRWRGTFKAAFARAIPLYGDGVGRCLPFLAA